MKEWAASEMMLTDPLKIPTTSFREISSVFEKMDRPATATFRFTGLVIPAKITAFSRT
jgi:hypothetical protein